VRAVIAESFERIHRSNLVGMGVLPLEFGPGENPKTMGLTGRESFTIRGLDGLAPGQPVDVVAATDDGKSTKFTTRARVDNDTEIGYMHNGGILPLVLRELMG
jgi:aconitate hydratase